MRLQFLGATGTVTGSKYLLSAGAGRLMIDCGLFQGYKQLRLRNWAPLPVRPDTIDAVILTHAHLDHSGYLPLLVREGFRGKIYCSAATADLCKIMLMDSAHLQEEEARAANRHGFSRHHPALPLYTRDDAAHCLRQFVEIGFEHEFSPVQGLKASLHRAGHILGAAGVRIDDGRRTLTFSGDLGRPSDPVMPAPAPLAATDYLVVESTYGNRRHDPADPRLLLGQVIRETAARGGVTVIPSFAVGRAQSLLYYMDQLKRSGEIPAHLPVYLDSPMATDATELYARHREDHRLDRAACAAMCHVATIANTPQESMAIDQLNMPAVVIAASGMATGGRVLYHLQAFADDARNTILFAGFQAGGTRGASMLAGATSIRIHGADIAVRAQVRHIDNLSAHADADETLAWLGACAQPPRQTFITHGEPDAADALRLRIQHQLHWSCQVPEYLQTVELD